MPSRLAGRLRSMSFWRNIFRYTIPWLIAGAYMLLSDLYARDMHFRFDKVVLCIIIMVSYALGHVFMIFLTAIHDLQARGVLISALHAVLFGLCSIAFNLWVLDGYSWGAAPAAGVIAGATSVSAFSALLKWGRLDGQRSSANTESHYDSNTAQKLELQGHVQGDVQARFWEQNDGLLPRQIDSSYKIAMPPKLDRQLLSAPNE